MTRQITTPCVMQMAPTHFEGTLRELYDRHIEAVLPSRDSVLQFHEWMCRYVDATVDESTDWAARVFPVRAVTGMQRGQVVRTADGTAMVPCDNSPAWVVHALLLGGAGTHQLELKNWADFQRLMSRDIATHMFDVLKCVRWSANTQGWYVAHILPAKNRDIVFRNWNRQEVCRRFFRTLHPCNLFFVPGARNRELGESVDVIAFVTARFAERYGHDLWQDFVSRSVDLRSAFDWRGTRDDGGLYVRLPMMSASRPHVQSGAQRAEHSTHDSAEVEARYRASRLTFKRDVIEPLGSEDVFEVITPHGTFRFTKSEFYADFPGIPLTASYREKGIYHGANLHEKALHRRIVE
ncbi:MAG: hypothetical protein SGI92_06120 [Bryobacteraceae bacterium]|nr:hypothetical protein [Bryobacteraceae bacterium]